MSSEDKNREDRPFGVIYISEVIDRKGGKINEENWYEANDMEEVLDIKLNEELKEAVRLGESIEEDLDETNGN